MDVSVFGTAIEIDETLIDESAETIERQLRAYETDAAAGFDLQIAYPDDFTGTVMRAMAEIPRGETRSYGDLAEGLDTAPIAVGGACGRNPLPVIVPCHRVVGTDSLTGYVGGLDRKRTLLEHEGASIPGEGCQSTR